MEHLSTQTSSDSSADVDTSVVHSADQNTSNSDWIKRAVQLRRYTPVVREAKPPVLVAPEWITSPTPVYQPASTQRTNLSALLSRSWHSQWRNRDWEFVTEFIKSIDQDECPVHDIIRIGDPLL